MKTSLKLSLISASTAAVIMMTPNISYAIDTGIFNSGSDKCLEIDGSSNSNGARAQQWDCRGQSGAIWHLYRAEDGSHQIVNNSGKCLEVADSRVDNGAPVQQWTCTGARTQSWYIEQSQDFRHSVLIFNANSGKVLEVENSSSRNGARVQQWDYSYGARGQLWSYGLPR
ncbi:RICIN domain-containing protein [Streptomyces gamaensis]|uniref:RICIN domain-containing protein n=1 Tax=Streptomyces gamaensis TaxID=1763542 RepID=A0ABW0Z5D6_9ACTN